MIVFFVGTPGSGKTYEAVKKIIDNLRLGRTVCTNIDGMDQPKQQEYIKALLDMDDYTFSQRFRFLTPVEVVTFWKTKQVTKKRYLPNDETEDVITSELICPKGSLIVLDECHKFFNCRSWNDKEKSQTNLQMADWASTHRHEGYDLVMITQDIEKVEKQVRSLTEWCYFFRKVNFLGGAVQKKYLCYAYSGDDHRGKPLSKSARTYQQKYFPCYQSYSSADAKEVGFMTHVNVLKHPVFFAIPLVLAFCIWMASKSSLASGDLFGTDKRMKASAAKIEQDRKLHSQSSSPVVAPGALVQQPVSSSRPPLLSSGIVTAAEAFYTYPVQGVVHSGLQTFYLVHDRIFRPADCRNYNSVHKTIECFGPLLQSPSSSSPVVSESAPDSPKTERVYVPSEYSVSTVYEKIDGEWKRLKKTYRRTSDRLELVKVEPESS